MRLFIGIILPKEIRDEIYEVMSLFSRNVAKIKWIAKKNLHLTLKFIGEVDDKEFLAIEKLLENLNFKSFEVNLNEFGVFPNLMNPKVFWINLFPEKKVIELQQKVDSELLGFISKDQIFVPHITLGRIKLVKKKNELVEEIKETKIEKKRFKINHFCLIESKLSKDGPKYKILKTFEA